MRSMKNLYRMIYRKNGYETVEKFQELLIPSYYKNKGDSYVIGDYTIYKKIITMDHDVWFYTFDKNKWKSIRASELCKLLTEHIRLNELDDKIPHDIEYYSTDSEMKFRNSFITKQ
jgi:signal peptidase I